MDNQVSNFQLLVKDVRQIIEFGQQTAKVSLDATMIATYWNIGRRIVEFEQGGQSRAAYGKGLLRSLSQELLSDYGSGYSERYLAYFRKMYLTIPQYEILQTRLQNLTWSHLLTSLRVEDEKARRWYLESASNQGWSVREMSRIKVGIGRW